MSLPSLALAEPLVTAMVTLLQANLNTTIDNLNATITDGFTIDHIVQVLPYVPVPSTLEGGMPVVGIQDLPARFEDDLQTNLDAVHEYAVVATLQNADHQTLAWQLRRTMQAIANTIQDDRVSNTSIMRVQARAWSVQFLGTEPGPLLGDFDPQRPEGPPTSYISYMGLLLSSKRTEV